MIALLVTLTVIAILYHGYKMVRIAITGKTPADRSGDYAARRLGIRRR